MIRKMRVAGLFTRIYEHDGGQGVKEREKMRGHKRDKEEMSFKGRISLLEQMKDREYKNQGTR